MTYSSAATAYRENAVLTASPDKIIRLLYERAIGHMERCRAELADPATCRSATVGESIGKAFAIISELRTALDHEQGADLSRDLDRLYEFAQDQLSQANMSRTPEPMDHVLRVMRTLKEGWDGIAAS